MKTAYQYFAIVDAEHGIDNPLFVVREWTTASGSTNEEVLTGTSSWELTNQLQRLRAEKTDQWAVSIPAPRVVFTPFAAPIPAPAAKKTSKVKLGLLIGVPVIVLLLALLPTRSSRAPSIAVGDCLIGSVADADSVTPADCGANAKYKVVGKKMGTDQILGMDGAHCEKYPTADAVYWEGVQGSKGTTLCLEDLKTPGKRLPAGGDCLKGDATDADKLDKVDCAGPEAAYRVLGTDVETGIKLDSNGTCAEFPATGAMVSWKRAGGIIPSTSVLCLEDLKKPGIRLPVVGDCVQDAPEVRVVECGQPARFKVVGLVENASSLAAQTKPVAEICAAFPTADQVAYWSMAGSLSGTAACMETIGE